MNSTVTVTAVELEQRIQLYATQLQQINGLLLLGLPLLSSIITAIIITVIIITIINHTDSQNVEFLQLKADLHQIIQVTKELLIQVLYCRY